MDTPRILGIIPARYASSRFPGKPLAMIGGTSMVRRVIGRAQESGVFDKVVVATDDERIFRHVSEGGGIAVMTSADHTSGTSRCLEAMETLSQTYGNTWDVVVNIQGDEPFTEPSDLHLICSPFTDPATQIATLVAPIHTRAELDNPNIVKAVLGSRGQALYFSRSPIPFVRDLPPEEWLNNHTFYRHLGIYAYSSVTLRLLCALDPASVEQAESLEQLRWLAEGFRINTLMTNSLSFGIDTPRDLEKAEGMAKQQMR